MSDAPLVEKMRKAFPFQRDPKDCADGGAAFLSFLIWASGITPSAVALQQACHAAIGKAPVDITKPTPEETAQYIDWLIEHHWGDADSTGTIH